LVLGVIYPVPYWTVAYWTLLPLTMTPIPLEVVLVVN
jgi:hypothetical protein